MQNYRKLIKYILPHKYLLITAAFFSLLFSISNGLTIYTVVPIFDTLTRSDEPFKFNIPDEEKIILQKPDPDLRDRFILIKINLKQKVNSFFQANTKKRILIIISLAIIPLVVIRGLFDLIARFLFAYAGNKTVLNIRNELYSHIIRLPFRFFHKNRSGEIISRLTGDVIPLTNALSTNIYEFISGIILFITNIIILLLLNWKLVIFIIILIPAIYLPVSLLGNKVKKYTRKIQEGFADISSHLEETFSGIKVIKSFNMESFENEKFDKINNRIFAKDIRKRIYQNLNPSIVEFLGAIAITGLFIYGGYQIINGHISSGEFIFFMLITLNLFDPVKNISEAVNGTKAGEAASERLNKIFNDNEEVFNNGRDAAFTESIEIKNLNFKYENESVLENINITIRKNTTTGIAGISGSGKSSLLNLISSFYTPDQGNVLFDRTPASELSLNSIREKIAYVTQDVFLFHGTVLENITCGREIKQEKVIEAAKIAHAHEFISKLPEKYDTIVGEKGALLSGGERQRISIARAILADPEIILFDEATSSLDSESEKMIQDSLNVLFKNRTSIIVSHRLSTIQYAHTVYFIEKGKITDSGTHDELLIRSEGYRRLFTFQ